MFVRAGGEVVLYYVGPVPAFNAYLQRSVAGDPFTVRIFTDYPFEASPVWHSLKAFCPSATVRYGRGIEVLIGDTDLAALRLALG